MDYLQNGITVKYYVNGEERSNIVYLISYAITNLNTFQAVNQFTYIENGNNRRPDIILFVNGLPLVVIELKSPSKDDVGAENAYNQIRNYMKDIPSLFTYNAFCVISDLSTNRAGTITAGIARFMEWKTVDGKYESTAYADFTTFYEGIFPRERLLDIIKILFCSQTKAPLRQRSLPGIINTLPSAKQQKKLSLPQRPMAKAAYSGTPKAAENPCPWSSMRICCSKYWTNRPLLS